jgi:YD repeat-containing protein
MKNRQAHTKLTLWIIALLTFISIAPSHSETIYYSYDDLNRLTGVIKVESNGGKVIEYGYDEIGNRLSKALNERKIITATAGPNGRILPSGGIAVTPGGSQSFNILSNKWKFVDIL